MEIESEEKEDGACTYLHCNKNCVMKLLMHCTDKHMKQEIQISSIKRKHCLLDEKFNKEDKGQKGSLLKENYLDNIHMTSDEIDDKTGTETNKNSGKGHAVASNSNNDDGIKWKRKHYDMRAEKDACVQKLMELEKAHEKETASTTQTLRSFK